MNRFGVKHIITTVLMTLAWCGLWGSMSAANVISGAAVSAGSLAVGLGTSGRGGLRPGPMLLFAGLVLVDLTQSVLAVARDVVTPTKRANEGIVAVRIPEQASRHVLLLSIAINLTPGTAVVEADTDNSTLYIHMLYLNQREATEAHVRRLAELACRALPESTVGANS